MIHWRALHAWSDKPAPNADAVNEGTGRINDRNASRNAQLLVAGSATLVFMAAIAPIPESLALMQGTRDVGGDLSGLSLHLRLARELLLILILGLFAIRFMQGRFMPRLSWGLMIGILLSSSWVVLLAFYSAALETSSLGTLALGVRLLAYAPVAIIAWNVQRHSAGALVSFASVLRWFILFEAVVAGFQLATGSGPGHNETPFGIRVFGTFAHWNAFGATMAASAVIFLLAHLTSRERPSQPNFQPWLWLVLMLTVLSGSRGSMVVAAAMAIWPFLQRLSRDLSAGAYTGAAVLLAALTMAISSPAIVGRNVSLQTEGRFAIWMHAWHSFNGPSEVMLGTGLGSATNAALNVEGFRGDALIIGNTHSVFLTIALNFGMLTLVGLFVALVLYVRYVGVTYGLPVAVAALLLGIPYNWLEFAPANLLLFLAFGFAARGCTSRWAPKAQPLSGSLYAKNRSLSVHSRSMT